MNGAIASVRGMILSCPSQCDDGRDDDPKNISRTFVMTVLIAGGGIGGLTLALSLHQIGVPARIFESATRLAPLGVGINILPHAVRELTELGLGATVERIGVPTSELAYFSKHGQRIWSEARGREAGYAWPQISLHRGELQMMLRNAVVNRLGPDAILTGHNLVDWEDIGDGIRVRFLDAPGGSEQAVINGSLLIACDGIHSAARARVYPREGSPIWNGAVLWRGTTMAAPFLNGRTMIMAGHEFQKFVCYPLCAPDPKTGFAMINWVAERKFPVDGGWRREDWNRQGNFDDFLPWFEDWDFDWLDAPELIRGAKSFYEYPMVDRDPLDQWTHGRMTLLGDAAHPMYPIGSNGASQAILDARVLTREIQRQGACEAALVTYEEDRRPATSRIVLANRGNGPEQVMQMVEQRAPDGYERIEDVLSSEELENAAAGYKKLAGFDRDELNNRASIVTL
jgi:5-methylphenazine-1-carboxylate 1-monooxygenase